MTTQINGIHGRIDAQMISELAPHGSAHGQGMQKQHRPMGRVGHLERCHMDLYAIKRRNMKGIQRHGKPKK
jgi:hypothetical protein